MRRDDLIRRATILQEKRENAILYVRNAPGGGEIPNILRASPLRATRTPKGWRNLLYDHEDEIERLPVETVRIADLRTVQTGLDREGLVDLLERFDSARAGVVTLVQLGDAELVLLDGNHRTAAALLLGVPTVRARILRLETRTATRRAITKADIEQLRKEFLVLVGNVPRVKTYRDLDKLRSGCVLWAKKMERRLEDLRDDLNGIIVSNKYKPVYDQNANLDWAAEYETKIGQAFVISSNMMCFPSETIESARHAWGFMDPTREFLEGKVLERWRKESPAWDARLRRNAPKAWKILIEILEWAERTGMWGGGGEALTEPVRTVENQRIEGFQVQLVGYDPSNEFDVEGLEQFRAGLIAYRAQANTVCPWLIGHQLPLVLFFSASAEDKRAAAFYAKDHIGVTVWGIHGKPREVAKQQAHEMGHHVHRTVLTDRAQNLWSEFVRGDYKDLDLREVVGLLQPNETIFQLGDRIEREDPILHLQIATLIHNNEYAHRDLFSFKAIEEYLAGGGDPIVRVPAQPITGYAGKNSEEAFCEVLGLLVGYGPRAVLPEIRDMFSRLVPGARVSFLAARAARQWLGGK